MPDNSVTRTFVNRDGDTHIDVRCCGLDFVISWRHAHLCGFEPYVKVFGSAWPMFSTCADIFAWLADRPTATRPEVAAALIGMGYVDTTAEAEELVLRGIGGGSAGSPSP